ncbi:glycosyltransferase [bacterium]|nr:glycosyltransferase [bacterium]
MKFVITTFGSAGDVHPFMALALQLQGRGHEVVIVTSVKFQPAIEARGLRCVPLGSVEEYDRVLLDPRLWDRDRGLEVVLGMMTKGLAPTIEVLRKEIVAGATVLVASSLGFAARIVGEQQRVPVASVHLAPSLFWSAFDPPFLSPQVGFLRRLPPFAVRAMYRLMDFAVDKRFGRALNAEFVACGYRPVRDLFSRWLHSPDLTVAMFPDWFAAPQRDWPHPHFSAGFPVYTEQGDAPLDPVLEQFLAAGDAPITFAPGSANVQCARFFLEALTACKALGRRAVFVAPSPDTVPRDLPPGILALRYVPFERLFARSCAVVYHGGIGTLAQCCAAGVPQLVMPMAHDQFDNAQRIARLGNGRVLPSDRFKEPAVERELRALLETPSYRQQAAVVAGRMKAGCDWDGLVQRLVALGG